MVESRRIRRERKTAETMIHIYCRGMHRTRGALCPDCEELKDYAAKRLTSCPFKEGKTTCANCAVHCYRPSMREKIKLVMQYAGPRMTYRHPLLAAAHFLDGFRKNRTVRKTGKS